MAWRRQDGREDRSGEQQAGMPDQGSRHIPKLTHDRRPLPFAPRNAADGVFQLILHDLTIHVTRLNPYPSPLSLKIELVRSGNIDVRLDQQMSAAEWRKLGWPTHI